MTGNAHTLVFEPDFKNPSVLKACHHKWQKAHKTWFTSKSKFIL